MELLGQAPEGRLTLPRGAMGRKAQPAAAIINSQSVCTTEAGGPRGHDGGKKISGRKRVQRSALTEGTCQDRPVATKYDEP